MSIARTLKIKHLVIATDQKQFDRIRKEKGWLPRDYKMVTTEKDLAGYHFFPVQNCTLHILGNHPIMTTDAFRNLIMEKAIEK